MSRDILHRKAGAGDAVGGGRWIGGRSFEKSAHLLVESPVKKAFLSTIQADPSRPLFRMGRHLVLIKLTCYHEEQENVDKKGGNRHPPKVEIIYTNIGGYYTGN